MADVDVFWDPSGFQLDRLGTNKYTRSTDGDTPYVEMAIRMLSIDTPEVHYPGTTNPIRHDEKLKQLAVLLVKSGAMRVGLIDLDHPLQWFVPEVKGVAA